MAAGNDAIHANPSPDVQQHITTHGSDWLWAVFAIMLVTDLIIIGWHFMIPRGQRVFHQLCAILLTTAAIAYFSMASNLGYAAIPTEFGSEGFPAGVYRQIWYVRYIDWVVTTPALLLTVVLASGLPLSDVITLAFFDLVMIVTGLVGSLVASSYKWGYYTFGCLAMFYVFWVLLGPGRTSAGVLGADYKKTFTTSSVMLIFLWTLYPIAWGLADGANVISPDSEMIFYGILDVLAKPVFTMYHLFSISKLDLTALQLSSGKFSSSAVGATHYDSEKASRHHNTAANGALATGTEEGNVNIGAGKKGFFAKKGRYDANTNRNSTLTAVDNEHPTNGAIHNSNGAPPRLSGATAVSH